MNQGGDVAELMVKESIEIAEAAARLAALGMKNLAALVLALAKDEHRVAGLTNIGRMLKDGSCLKVFELGSGDIARFTQAAKQYGVLFTIIETPGTRQADVVVREGDVQRVCRIFEHIGYAVPQEAKEDTEKNAHTRAPHEKKSDGRGSGWRASEPQGTPGDKQTAARDDLPDPPSVVSRVEAIKRARANLQTESTPAKNKVKAHVGPVK